MKHFFLILIVFLLYSCGGISMLSKQEIIVKFGCLEVESSDKTLIIPVEIDGRKSKFLFDTGATTSILIDSTIIDSFESKRFSNFGSVKGGDRKKIQNKLLTVSVKSSLFESKNKVLSFINMPLKKCQTISKNFSGIIGFDLIFGKSKALQIDFTNNKICNISDLQFQENHKKNYERIKSKCRQGKITIYLKIEKNEYAFTLDTGYNGNIILPYGVIYFLESDKKIELEGSVFQTIYSHTSGKELIYEKMPISFAGQNIESKVNVSSSIKSQVVGIEFIKAFDWLIDYNNNEVYVKRNQNKIESAFTRKVSYYAKANLDKLNIVVKEKSQTQYHLGDQIITVNNQKVTAENNCELQDLLNKTEDWNTLQLEVISIQ